MPPGRGWRVRLRALWQRAPPPRGQRPLSAAPPSPPPPPPTTVPPHCQSPHSRAPAECPRSPEYAPSVVHTTPNKASAAAPPMPLGWRDAAGLSSCSAML
eukprot:1187845-Prorocentrum_minimum.AAC.5